MINNLKSFLNEEQDPKAVEKVADKLNSMMMSDEEVQYIAVQKKPAITIAPDCIALTNKRIIFFRSKNMGLSTEFEDIVWKDVLDSHLKENIWGGEFTVQTVDGAFHKIDFLQKNQSRKLYAVVQEQEEKQKNFAVSVIWKRSVLRLTGWLYLPHQQASRKANKTILLQLCKS